MEGKYEKYLAAVLLNYHNDHTVHLLLLTEYSHQQLLAAQHVPDKRVVILQPPVTSLN